MGRSRKVTPDVVSADERPFPVVMQRNGHDCGPAVARAVLEYFGKPRVGVDRTLRPHPVHGTAAGGLMRLFAAAGLGLAVRGEMTAGELADRVTAGKVAVCPVQWDGDGHWVAVHGATRTAFRVMCPGRGAVTIDRAAFVAAWHDATPAGERLDRYALIVSADG